MTRKEIAAHLQSECRNNKDRIEKKIWIVSKKMLKAGKKTHVYQQRVGFNTLLTIYIYGVDQKEGVDYAKGCWYHSEKGLCWASVGQYDVNFYSAHFFERFAERGLRQSMSVQDSAKEFYKQFRVAGFGQNTEEIEEGIYKLQVPLYDGGLALGFNDRRNNIVFFNTYVSKDMLGEQQIIDLEDNRELDEALLSLNTFGYTLIIEAMKLADNEKRK